MAYGLDPTGGTAADRFDVIAAGANVSGDFHFTQIDEDNSSPPVVKPVMNGGNVAAAGTTKMSTDVVANHHAVVASMSYVNVHASAAHTVQFQIVINGGTARKLTPVFNLNVGDKVEYDGEKWWLYDSAMGVKTAVAISITRTVITSGTAATYTTPAGCRAIDVEILGPGGGGAGSANAASNASFGGGGGSGAYCRKLYSPPAATYTYTIGTGGGGGSGAANGSAGSASTTWGALTAPAGQGGIFQATQTTALATLGGAGGAIASGGDINYGGQPGGTSYRANGTIGISGFGAPSALSGSAAAGLNTTAAGVTAIANSGCGGSGAATVNGGGVQTGGSGAAGVIIVTEWY